MEPLRKQEIITKNELETNSDEKVTTITEVKETKITEVKERKVTWDLHNASNS